MSITSKTHALMLQRFAEVGQTEVERQSGVDNTQLSKFCKGERGLRIEQLEPVFKALGIRLVECDGDVVHLPREEHQALLTLARKALK